MKKPIISVVIPAHNEAGFIRPCLNSLIKQTLHRNFFEVVVVDNASTDKTAKIIKEYPFKYVFEPKRSVVLARQTGVDNSVGKIIVSADADTIYPPDWLKTIKTNFEKDSDLVALVGWIYYRDTSPIFNVFNALNQEINLLFNKYTKRFPIAYAANLAFKREALEAIGGYPKHLTELGDQQYLLFKFFKLGKVKIEQNVRCFTSGRRFHSLWQNIIIYNGWYRIIGYLINRSSGKEIIGPAPAVRKITPPRKSHFFR